MLQGWAPEERRTSRRVDPWPATALAAALDQEAPVLLDGRPLPPLWHWLTLVDHCTATEVGEDGHPARGALLPPIPNRRRMFAGGRLRQFGPVTVGSRLDCCSRVSAVRVKSGRSGELAFVTVHHQLAIGGVAVAEEEQDLVYRSGPPAGSGRQPSPSADAGSAPRSPDWRFDTMADPVLLFRFSALTYNSHRIHYDRPYATEVEGHPGLVVQGPLLALLALELPRRHAPDERVVSFDYRLTRPVFAPVLLTSAGRRDGDLVEVAVGATGQAPSLVATARLG
ncbi:hypothetical protein BJF78_23620 [Pseudonocardia sp. CNS-139]|nr:hypothetical protein BJF78_23620 [Pseudonocardia sp. CNS-139]